MNRTQPDTDLEVWKTASYPRLVISKSKIIILTSFKCWEPFRATIPLSFQMNKGIKRK